MWDFSASPFTCLNAPRPDSSVMSVKARTGAGAGAGAFGGAPACGEDGGGSSPAAVTIQPTAPGLVIASRIPRVAALAPGDRDRYRVGGAGRQVIARPLRRLSLEDPRVVARAARPLHPRLVALHAEDDLADVDRGRS